VKLADGTDVSLIATGIEVEQALAARELLAAEGISASVINIHTIKPLDEDLVVAEAQKTGAIVTCEEHSIIGGLGGAVAECLSAKCPTPVLRVGVEDTFGRSGPAKELVSYFGLDAAAIAAKAKAAVALKK
jgi:transketolase